MGRNVNVSDLLVFAVLEQHVYPIPRPPPCFVKQSERKAVLGVLGFPSSLGCYFL
jgi:hypothetical protein